MDLDFSFIKILSEQIRGGLKFYEYTIDGLRALAILFILIKIVEIIISFSTSENKDWSRLFPLFGYIVLLGIYPNVMQIAEDGLQKLDELMYKPEHKDLYKSATDLIWDRIKIEGESIDLFSAFDVIGGIFYMLIIALVASFLQIGDYSITASYLLQRVFIIEFLKFVLPIVVVLSLTDKFKNAFVMWIKRFIGMFLLGLSYIAVIKFTIKAHETFTIMNTITVTEDPTSVTDFAFWSLLGVCFIFTLKVKLLAMVTSYVQSFSNSL